MSQELIMMLNGDQAVHLSADAANDVTADGMIAAFYNEMQQSIQTDADAQQVVVIDESQNIVASNFSAFKDLENFKGGDSSAEATEGISNTEEMVPNGGGGGGASEENLIINYDGVAVSLTDDNYLKSKNLELADSLKLEILENSEFVSDTAEPALEPEKHSYHFWECSKCSALFNDPNACQLHLSKAHDFTCGICSEPFQEKEELENHIITHIADIPGHELQMIHKPMENVAEAPITKDTEAITSAPVEQSSISQASVETPTKERYICSSCGLSFQSSQNLQEHEETHANEESFLHSQDIVPISAPPAPPPPPPPKAESESSLKGHARICCDTCDFVCYTKNALLLHMNKKHRGTKISSFTCDECGQSFKWELSLENHLVIQHNRKRRCLSCPTCDKIFSSVPALNEHQRTHENDNSLLSCDACGEKFQQSVSLLNHMKANHPDIRGYSCTECNKTFRVKQFLQAHMSEVHPDRGGNKCDICLKSFMSSDSLSNHFKTHHSGQQEQKYSCEICHLTFSDLKEQYQHMTIHVAEIKNFQCQLCDEAFHKKDDLTAHMETHEEFND